MFARVFCIGWWEQQVYPFDGEKSQIFSPDKLTFSVFNFGYVALPDSDTSAISV
jgi:hypothetical protein